MQRLLPVELGPARRAAMQVLFNVFFLLAGQLAVKVKIFQLLDRFTIHTKSPNPARIFWVARNKQFLAASSVVLEDLPDSPQPHSLIMAQLENHPLARGQLFERRQNS